MKGTQIEASEAQNKPSETQTEQSSEAKTEGSSEAQSKPSETQTEQSSEAKTEGSSEAQSKPSETQTERSSDGQTEASEAQDKVSSEAETETSDAQTEAISEAKTEAPSDAQTEASSSEETEPSSAEQAKMSSEAQIKTEDVDLDISQVQEETRAQDNPPPSEKVVNVATPWKISAIQEVLGGRYDRNTIIGMLQQCRGNIDRAFANLLDDSSDGPSSSQGQGPASRPSSPRPSSSGSAGTKCSVDDDDSDSEEEPRSTIRPPGKRRRILPGLTVGIALGEGENDVVSLKLRVGPDTAAERGTSAPASDSEGPAKRPRRRRRRYGRHRRLE